MARIDLAVVPRFPPPNVVPKSTYRLPLPDKGLPEDVQQMLKAHPMAYALDGAFRGGWFNRCPCCEQWTGVEGCDVRRLALEGKIEEATKLHHKREWPAGTGKKTTEFRNMKPDYSQVTYEYV